MLDSYFYRLTHQIRKKPVNLLLVLFALLFTGLMVFYPTIIRMDEAETIVRVPETAVAFLRIIGFAMFNLSLFAMTSGTISGYTVSDVNFHLAGPFSRTFNKIIGVINNCKTSVAFCFVLCCQAAVFVSIAGFNTLDMLVMLLVVFFSSVSGSIIANIFAPIIAESENLKKKVKMGFYAVLLLCFAIALLSVISKVGSVTNISSLPAREVIGIIGNSWGFKVFPFSGWVTLIYSGAVFGNPIYIGLGIILVIIGIVLIAFLIKRVDVEYYEIATESALKIADMVEAKKAGVDTDSVKLNRNIKVGKEEFDKGWGASAFLYKNLFEYTRQSKFFFVNSLALLYRVIMAVYLFIMSRNGIGLTDSVGTFISSAMSMSMILNAIVYSGGKTVLEFNRPFFFLIPEKTINKVLNCVMADIPSMIFDSVICAATVAFFTGSSEIGIGTWVLYGIMMLVFDLTCEVLAISQIRLFRGLGKYGLMIVRYITLIVVTVVTVMIGGILMEVSEVGYIMLFASATALCALLLAVSLIICAKTLDSIEMN